MEAITLSETSVDTQRTTRRYIPEDNTLYNHCCEKLKSWKYAKFVITVEEMLNGEYICMQLLYLREQLLSMKEYF
jgi:hypothetical protein